MSAHIAAIPYLDRPTDTNSSSIAPPGALRIHKHPTLGMQVYRPVRNTSGGLIEIARVAQLAIGSTYEVAKSGIAAPNATIAGVTVAEIADDDYGWVLCSGVAPVQSTASTVVAGALVSTLATDGMIADTAVAGIEHCQFGRALNGVGGGGGIVNVLVSGLL